MHRRAAGVVYQIGVAPRRIDILTDLTALTFAEAWPVGCPVRWRVDVNFMGRAAFIRNKRATGRTRDLADLEGLD